MDRERYASIKRLFGRALELEGDERAAYLEREGDTGLREEVLDLLERAETRSFLLDGEPELAAGRLPSAGGPPEVPGFRIVERLGQGGMGVVWLAEQLSPRRTVALKCLRMDWIGADVPERLQREGEILGRLSHPGIAQVYGAGLVEGDGLPVPWIAMEHVRGVSLGEWVRARGLDLRGKVRLIAELCDAVQHAHDHRIVHRDLKPSNVLVQEDGRVRVLDFGVARLLEDEEAPSALRTRTGQLIGTLAYMSPEQARGESATVDERSDVYNLGVLLYELVDGDLPYPINDAQVYAGIRTICEEDPEPLRRRRPEVPRDLERVLQKALEKEPDRRYRNAGALRNDLQRFLEHRPVAARPPSAAYQVRKLVHRHPGLATSLGVILLALGVTALVTDLSRRRVRAQLELTSDSLEFFAAELIELVPALGFGENQRGTLEAILGRLEAQLEKDASNHGLLAMKAEVLYELANLHQAAQRPDDALDAVARAQAIIVQVPGREARVREHVLHVKMGELSDDLEVRRAYFLEARARIEALLAESPGDPELLEDLGWCHERLMTVALDQGREEEADQLARLRLREARELVERDGTHWKLLFNLAAAHRSMGTIHRRAGDVASEERELRQAFALFDRLCGMQPARRDFLVARAGLVIPLAPLVSNEEASELSSTAIARLRHVLEADANQPGVQSMLLRLVQLLAKRHPARALEVLPPLLSLAGVLDPEGAPTRHGLMVGAWVRWWLTCLESADAEVLARGARHPEDLWEPPRLAADPALARSLEPVLDSFLEVLLAPGAYEREHVAVARLLASLAPERLEPLARRLQAASPRAWGPFRVALEGLSRPPGELLAELPAPAQ